MKKFYLINLSEGFWAMLGTRGYSFDDPELDILEFAKTLAMWLTMVILTI